MFLHLIVDGGYFLSGMQPTSEEAVRVAVEEINKAIREQLQLGTETVSTVEQRVMFFSSATMKVLQQRQQRDVLMATLRRLRFQVVVLDCIPGSAGSPVDAAMCTRTMSALSKSTAHSLSSPGATVPAGHTTFVYMTSNAYVNTALEWVQSAGCGICFVVYSGDLLADELLVYAGPTVGNCNGVATVKKGDGVGITSTLEVVGRTLHELEQKEGKEMPLGVLTRLKQLQRQLAQGDVTVDGYECSFALSDDFGPSDTVGRNCGVGNVADAHEESNLRSENTQGAFVAPKNPGKELYDTSDNRAATEGIQFEDVGRLKAKEGNASGLESVVESPPGFTQSRAPQLVESQCAAGQLASVPQQQTASQMAPEVKQSVLSLGSAPHTSAATAAASAHQQPSSTLPSSSNLPEAAEPPVSTSLPSGWTLMFDRHRQRHYFVFKDPSGAVSTTWMHPGGAAHQMELERQVEVWCKEQQQKQLLLQQGGQSHLTPATGAAPNAPLPVSQGDWVEHVDTKTGRKYYVNHRTRQTSWTIPADASVDQSGSMNRSGDYVPINAPSSSHTAMNQAGIKVIQFWEKHMDPKTGRPFYVNRQTRETTWAPPPPVTNTKPAQSQPLPVQQTATGAVPATVVPTPQRADLLPFWEEHFDPNVGRSFYVNQQTRETTWVRPCR
ncbi:WW domain [Trypanosoma vivax]|uniref:WW domain-containing protein n=1 Tax=Trypanosoma vivax (strain Y486) TaxID=1055687 RepID=G0U1C5_TRYVY|nr:WW domain [Trypanosoma vivax]CCC49880.1 conserved hypothetical protein [Trypanosoma vivax Y486]